jgi:hypothetical protein
MEPIMNEADLIVVNAKVTTLQHPGAEAAAFAVRDEKFVAVGADADVLALQGDATVVVDAAGRRVVPGLNDSHMHAIRGGLMYNLELRWDGVTTLARGLEMIRTQATRTPEGSWVRIMGGWSPYQFEERRMPTVAELNEAGGDVPVLVNVGSKHRAELGEPVRGVGQGDAARGRMGRLARILFGSDFPYAPAAVGRSSALRLDTDAQLTAEHLAAINRDSALTLFPRLAT